MRTSWRRDDTTKAWIIAFCFLCMFTICAGSRGQETSLGDVARQTRAQRQATPNTNNKAQELADQMEQEQEASESAPLGFKSYNAGDYRLFVPFPYELAGRDGMGTILAGSQVGLTNTEVVVGNPIPLPPNLTEDATFRFVAQIARQYGNGVGCSPLKLGERRAYRCSLGRAYLLNHEVWGTMALVLGSNTVIPVVCVSPDEMNEHLVYGNSRASYQEKQAAFAKQARRFQDERTTLQLCDQVIYPSIRLKEDIVASSTAAKIKSEPTRPAPNTLASVSSPTAAPPHSVAANTNSATGAAPTVAEIARLKKQASLQTAKTNVTIDATGDMGLAPPGFRSLSFSYCKGTSNCWTGSTFVPSAARELNSYYSEYIYELPLGGGTVPEKLLVFVGAAALYGTNRLSTEPNLILWEEISDPEGWDVKRRLLEVIHDEGTVDGKPALLTHFELTKNNVVWVGKSAKVENHEVEVLAGCMAPKSRFGDADQICTMVIDSLRLP